MCVFLPAPESAQHNQIIRVVCHFENKLEMVLLVFQAQPLALRNASSSPQPFPETTIQVFARQAFNNNAHLMFLVPNRIAVMNPPGKPLC